MATTPPPRTPRIRHKLVSGISGNTARHPILQTDLWPGLGRPLNIHFRPAGVPDLHSPAPGHRRAGRGGERGENGERGEGGRGPHMGLGCLGHVLAGVSEALFGQGVCHVKVRCWGCPGASLQCTCRGVDRSIAKVLQTQGAVLRSFSTWPNCCKPQVQL